MELAKLLLKLIYLVVLISLCFTILRQNVETSKMNLMLLSFFVAVFIVYFTFNPMYSFLVDNELLFKSTQKKDNDNRGQTISVQQNIRQ